MSTSGVFRLFSPVKHTWLRVARSKGVSQTAKKSLSVEVGLTERAFEDIGDVSSVVSVFRSSKDDLRTVKAGDELLQINWDAQKITSADELYHTVWETVEGATTLEAPVAGIIDQVNIPQEPSAVDANTPLLKMSTDEKSLREVISCFVDEEQYLRLVEKESAGLFAEEN